MNVSLPDPLREFVEQRVAEGGYSTASEYFRELVRDDQKRSAQERLEMLLLGGLESGEAVEVTADDWARIRAEVRARVSARKQP